MLNGDPIHRSRIMCRTLLLTSVALLCLCTCASSQRIDDGAGSGRWVYHLECDRDFPDGARVGHALLMDSAETDRRCLRRIENAWDAHPRVDEPGLLGRALPGDNAPSEAGTYRVTARLLLKVLPEPDTTRVLRVVVRRMGTPDPVVYDGTIRAGMPRRDGRRIGPGPALNRIGSWGEVDFPGTFTLPEGGFAELEVYWYGTAWTVVDYVAVERVNRN